jgi:hypothetical protein
MNRVGAETLLKVYGVKVDPEEFTAFAGMGEAYFLSGVAGKYGIQIEDIDKLKEVFYGIYLQKAGDPTEDIGLPGEAKHLHTTLFPRLKEGGHAWGILLHLLEFNFCFLVHLIRHCCHCRCH